MVNRKINQLVEMIKGYALYCVFHKVGYKTVIICAHIGDYLYTMGYLSEYVKVVGNKVQIICSEKMENLNSYYRNNSIRFVCISEKKLQILINPYHFKLGRKIYKKVFKALIMEPAWEYPELFFTPAKANKTFCETIRKDVMGLRNETKFYNPFENSIGDKEREYFVLCPQATLINDVGVSQIFDEVRKELRTKKMKVYVNEEDIDLELIVQYFQHCNWVVGMRSGILDLAALCGCNVLAIFPKDYELIDYFSIEKNAFSKKKLIDYELSEDKGKDMKIILSIILEE